ncbi:MAG: SOS response-associated peptidase [Myxococcota bacterium]|nr:SOS response-associated peptidase [Myxococcota bacterium]
MCGRFTLSRSASEVAEHFGLDLEAASEGEREALEATTGRFNRAPTQPILTLRRNSEGRRVFEARHWGLVPRWSDHAEDAARMINARVESAATRPAFRDALKRRRCLVPADGFYEWTGPRASRVPRHIRLPDGGLFAMAGLYESWEGPGGQTLQSCTILTTEATEAISAIHDRMPLIPDPAHHARWLDREEVDGDAVLDGLTCRLADELELHPASTRVNDVKHDAPDCLVPEVEPQLTLF